MTLHQDLEALVAELKAPTAQDDCTLYTMGQRAGRIDAADRLQSILTKHEGEARDAARYRWLRAMNGQCDDAAAVMINIGFDWVEAHGDALDEAIDAAMQPQPPMESTHEAD